jgi:hypothetical protein
VFAAYELVTEPVLGRAPAMESRPAVICGPREDQPAAAARRAASTNDSAALIELFRSCVLSFL